jgi:hypothetical protein
MNTKVKVHPKVVAPNSLLEIFQQTACLFSYVVEKEDGFHQIIPPVKCRDFLGDMLWSRATEKKSSIYGLEYSFKDNPYDTERLALSIKFPDADTFNNFKNNVLPFIHGKEADAKVKNPTVFLETTTDLTLVVLADKVWQSAIWKISLYSFYLKCCCYADPNAPTNGTTEAGYRKDLKVDAEEKFLKAVKENFLWFPPDIETAHNSSGFLSILNVGKYLGDGYFSPEQEAIYHTIFPKKTKEGGTI